MLLECHVMCYLSALCSCSCAVLSSMPLPVCSSCKKTIDCLNNYCKMEQWSEMCDTITEMFDIIFDSIMNADYKI